MEICANICPRKLLLFTKESENIQLGNAEFERKVVLTNVNIYCVLCLSTGGMFLEISHTQPVLACLVSILANLYFKDSN
jgi:hypothetical protein